MKPRYKLHQKVVLIGGPFPLGVLVSLPYIGYAASPDVWYQVAREPESLNGERYMYREDQIVPLPDNIPPEKLDMLIGLYRSDVHST